MTSGDNNSPKPLLLTAQLVHEALEQLGWQGDAHAVAERVKRLDLGLPAEDEFAMLLTWLGKCCLVHSLDQFQSPPVSKNEYQVPDLLAVFEQDGKDVVTLIEVKATNEKILSWKPGYYEALKRYGDLLGVPTLVAWKHYNHWTLFDLQLFERPNQNYKMKVEKALVSNLMGVLAGDWAFVLRSGVGLHIVSRKEDTSSEQRAPDSQEEWLAMVEDVYFTNGEGERVTSFDRGLWQLFLSAPPDVVTQLEGEHIRWSFIISNEQGMQLAHRAVAFLLHEFHSGEQALRWRTILRTQLTPITAVELRQAAEQGIARDIVHYVIDYLPNTTPRFLATKPRRRSKRE